ncbi:MAG: DUF4926 domain-containing protein [Promethearchaeota archaeon]
MNTAKLPKEGDVVELLVDIPDYGLKRGAIGKILVVYDTYSLEQESDFEVFFDEIDTSVLLLESQFKLKS